jgi:photosystem II stability/assembly factor-like uncharacterized protein
MRSLTLVLIFFIFQPVGLLAQGWQQTAGPEGGNVRTVAALDTHVLAGMWNGNIYRVAGDREWTKVSSMYGLQELSVEGSTIFAKTYEGLVRSEDYGQTWIPILKASQSSLFSSIVRGPDALYFLVNDSLYRSSDGGETWRFRSTTGVGASLIGFCDGHIIAAGGFQGVVASGDRGVTWQRRDQSLPQGAFISSMVTITDRKKDEQEVWISINGKGVYYTDDGGEEWEQECDGLPTDYNEEYPTFNSIFATNEKLYGVANQMVYEFDDDDDRWIEAPHLVGKNLQAYDNVLYVSSSDGVLRSFDEGDTWDSIGDHFKFNSIADFAALGNTVIAAAQNGVFLTNDSGMSWVKTGNFYTLDIAAGHDNMYAQSTDGVMRSRDRGLTWEASNYGISEEPSYLNAVSANSRAAFAGFWYISGMHGTTSWTSGGIYRSTDGGDTWTDANDGISVSGYVHAPIQHIEAYDDVQFALAVDGLYRSTNDGARWAKINVPMEGTDLLYDIERVGDVIYVASYKSMFRSTDLGLTWQLFMDGMVAGGEGFENCTRVVDTMVVLSHDMTTGARRAYRVDSDKWLPYTVDLPSSVHVTSFITATGVTFAGTNENSVWSRQAPQAATVRTQQLATIESRAYPNPFSTTTTVSFTLPKSSYMQAALYDLTGRKVRDLGARQAQGDVMLTIDGAGLPAGTYLCRIETEECVSQTQVVLQP